jgi:molybdopterin molybdotransferase
MISFEAAQSAIRRLPCECGTEVIPLSAIHRHVLGQDIHATMASPHFDNSAMDGFACRGSDVKPGAVLHIANMILAGDAPASINSASGPSCIAIMTGAQIPAGFDSVIPVECTNRMSPTAIQLRDSAQPFRHIRRRGEDIEPGRVLYTPGQLLTPEATMIAANFGYSELRVRKKPRVLVLSTGNELRQPGEPLVGSQIYNSTQHFLRVALSEVGIGNAQFATTRDDPDAAKALIEDFRQRSEPGDSSLVISTGAVSMGVSDFVPDLARSLGFEVIFHGVKIRPGKPLFLAKSPGIVWLGLPGNPISSAVGWHFFALPVLRQLLGQPEEPAKIAKLSSDVSKPSGLTCLFRGIVSNGHACVLAGQGSAQFLATTAANAYIVLPEAESTVPAGIHVEVRYT